jgi:hypothetical protein
MDADDRASATHTSAPPPTRLDPKRSSWTTSQLVTVILFQS